MQEVGVLNVVHPRGIERAVVGEGDQLSRFPCQSSMEAADLGEVDVVAVRPPQRGDQARE